MLDKTILVRDGAGFQRKPIIYEHAFGGAGVVDNPLGVGETPGDGVPTLFDPRDPRRPAGFGPIARAWPARKRLLGATPRRALEGPVAEIPSPFDWSYFQAAPVDQRTDFLGGDEWIVLEGLHPALPLLRTRLPGVRGMARIHGLAAFGVVEGTALDLHLDIGRPLRGGGLPAQASPAQGRQDPGDLGRRSCRWWWWCRRGRRNLGPTLGGPVRRSGELA